MQILVCRDKMSSHDSNHEKSATKMNKKVTVHVSSLMQGCQISGELRQSVKQMKILKNFDS